MLNILASVNINDFDILPKIVSFRFDVSSESICQSKMKKKLWKKCENWNWRQIVNKFEKLKLTKNWKHRHSLVSLKNSLSRQNSSSTFDRAPLMWPRLILPCSSWLQNWYFYTLWIKRYKYKTLPILWYLITQVHQFCFSRLQTSTFIDEAIQKTGTHWFDKNRFFSFTFSFLGPSDHPDIKVS